MPRCTRCIHVYCPCLNAANDNFKGPFVYVRQDAEINAPLYIQSTARATAALDMPRRRVEGWVANVLVGYDGLLRYRAGGIYDIAGLPDFDLAFGNDGDATSVRDFLGYVLRPPVRAVRSETKARVRLISTAILIDRPELAARFDL